jgi:hypothetical protein
VGPTKPRTLEVPRVLSSGVKRPAHEIDRSLSSSVKVTSEWNCTPAPPVRLHRVQRDTFTFFTSYNKYNNINSIQVLHESG